MLHANVFQLGIPFRTCNAAILESVPGDFRNEVHVPADPDKAQMQLIHELESPGIIPCPDGCGKTKALSLAESKTSSSVENLFMPTTGPKTSSRVRSYSPGNQ